MEDCLSIRNLSHVYPDGTLSLSDVSLTVAAGARVALLGPNGAGKSTLMLHMNGVLMPQSGSVTVKGVRLSASTASKVRATVGLVFQDPDDQLFMTTVYEDVAFGPANLGLGRAETDERVHQALHAVGLPEATSKSSAHLSFGQKKAVALATVLSMQPDVLVLDEPTSNLDPRARRRMIGLLSGLPQTMILATHDMDLAWELCDTAVVLDGGRLVAQGAAEKVMSDEAVMLRHGLEVPPSAREAVGGPGAVQSRP